MRSATAVLLLAPLAPLLVAGCGNRDFSIESGTYGIFTAAGYQAADRDAVRQSRLTVNRDARTIAITFRGSSVTARFTPSERSTWPDGCPTNFSVARMETATLEPTALTIGSLTIAGATLVATCGLEPPGDGVLILPRPVDAHQPGCPDEDVFPCLGYSVVGR